MKKTTESVEEYVFRVISEILQIEPVELKKNLKLSGLGFDSISTILLRNQIKKDLDISLGYEVFFEMSNLEMICEFISKKGKNGI